MVVPSVTGTTPSQREMLAGEEARMRHVAFRPGSVIADKYIVERVIGEGGLGVVVAAHHQHLEQTVAIKYLRPKALGTKVVTERFVREARLAAKIRSQHVVRVYDVGMLSEGTPFMVMEYLDGTDLGNVIATAGPLATERAVDYVLQACEALAEAHLAGIVHRDLKPDNLFLAQASGKSTIKVLDFGISKVSSKRSETGRLAELTEANDQFGTPVYMSPEQLRSAADVDARADVWAVGVILFELLTGQLPFDGDGLPELCTSILTLPPASLTKIRSSLPEGLEVVVGRCLEKERENRFQNVAELAQELRPFATPAGRDSVDHIVRIVRDGGEPVRPTTPPPGDVTSRAIREAMTLAPSEGRTALTTSSGAASWGLIRVQPVVASKRGKVILAAAGAGILAVVAFTRVLTHAASSDPPSKAAAPLESAVPQAAQAAKGMPLAPTIEPVASVPPLPPAIETVAAQPVVSVEPARSPAPPTLPSRPAPSPRAAAPRSASATKSVASAAQAPAPAPFDPNAVINPFQ